MSIISGLSAILAVGLLSPVQSIVAMIILFIFSEPLGVVEIVQNNATEELLTIMYIVELLIIFLSALLAVAFLTVAERKTLGYMQRRVGPNAVGYYGILMAIADAAKLLLKEIIIPTHADKLVLFLSPVISLISALLC
ncbi:NADH-ubiquinone oxidoreductase chain 1 [Candida maltosa Xu316]|uniref:NADH-ubiquinone oxidoreductase chain 1 n=1 Tax=Candida maltosa (strain Xu316) TaxID=1245528 RepID=M3IG19_CANMX|nr:NADH-ubiquinone oxidoreductase chain 1 [Candida maltosa Xu316]